jgi:hypothetical protein
MPTASRFANLAACLMAAMTVAMTAIGATAAHAQSTPAAQQVFNRARAASGGAAWNRILGWHEVGRDDGAPFERWVDPVRYGLRTETHGPAGKLAQGYNGAGEWRILPDGRPTGSVAREVLADIRAEAFFGAHAYFYPSRFDLRASHLGVRQQGAERFDVVRVQPAGGEPRELWFDHKTGLLGLMVEGDGAKRRTVEYSDYRRVGGVLAPFRQVAYGAGLTRPRERVLERVDFTPADRAIFSLPRHQVAETAPGRDAAARAQVYDEWFLQPERRLAY